MKVPLSSDPNESLNIRDFGEKEKTIKEKSSVGAPPTEQEIPPETLDIIMDFVGREDFPKARILNKDWSNYIISKVHNEQESSLKTLLKDIVSHLDEKNPSHEKTLKYCNSLLEKSDVLGSVSLLDIKKNLLSTKEELIVLMKELDENTLSKIDTFCTEKNVPLNFKNLGKLPKLYNDLDEAMAEKYDEAQVRLLYANVRFLFGAGAYDKALEVAKLIRSSSGVQSLALQYLVRVHSELGNIDKAIEALKIIPSETVKQETLQSMLNVLIKKPRSLDKEQAIELKKQLVKVLAVEIKIKHSNDIDYTEHEIAAYKLCEKGDLEMALIVLNMIPDTYKSSLIRGSSAEKSAVLASISKKYCLQGDFNNSIKTAMLIPDSEKKSEALKFIEDKKNDLS